MPTDHVEMMRCRTIQQKKKLVAEITRLRDEVLGVYGGSVERVLIKARNTRQIGRP